MAGSALEDGLIEIVSARLLQRHPTDRKLNKDIEVAPEPTSTGTLVNFHEFEVPDWVRPNQRTTMRVRGSLHDIDVLVCCRALKVGDAELDAVARLMTPRSAAVRTSYPVTVLPDMWRPLKSSDQPQMTHAIHAIRKLNQPVRINALAVLRGEADQSVSAELSLESMLASRAESDAFWDRFKPQPAQHP